MMMMMTMMMMMMTPMKLVNSATKFRHGMDKFYQPNSGLRGSKSGDEAIYTHIHAGVSCGKWKSMAFPGKMIENKQCVFFTLILVYQRICKVLGKETTTHYGTLW